MDDDKIKQLFSDFSPEVSDSEQFLRRLDRHLAIAEQVRTQNAALKRRNRVAVVLAAASGFAMGVVLTMIFPYLRGWIASFEITLPRLSYINFSVDYTVLTWVVMAGVCLLTSLSVYEMAVARVSERGSGRSQLQ